MNLGQKMEMRKRNIYSFRDSVCLIAKYLVGKEYPVGVEVGGILDACYLMGGAFRSFWFH